MSSGKIIVIVAPSGTGKSTLIDRLKKEVPELEWSVSFTTRPIRPGETHGVNYFYTNSATFENMIANNEFVEWAKVHANYYGTSKKFVSDGIAQGKFLLFDLDVQGADAMKKHFQEQAQIIFITPPSIEELEKRLRGRGTENEETIQLRVKNAKHELTRRDDYDFCVLNDDVERAYSVLKKVVLKIMGRVA
jgi:guanylate kinase